MSLKGIYETSSMHSAGELHRSYAAKIAAQDDTRGPQN